MTPSIPKKRGRPAKKPINARIEDALGMAQSLIPPMPLAVQQKLISAPQAPVIVHNAQPLPGYLEDTKDDYEFARANLRGLLRKGNDILEDAIAFTKESESARSFEVAGNLVKSLIEGTRELMGLQKDVREVEKKSAVAPEGDITNVQNIQNNIVMEASTLEVLEIMDELKRKKAVTELNYSQNVLIEGN